MRFQLVENLVFNMDKKEKLTDEEIVEIVTTKDKEMYGEIIKRYQKKLINYAYYLLADESMAIDVVQDAFIKAYINLNGFDIKKKFSAWIYRIVHNEAINWLKRNKKTVPIDYKIDQDNAINIEDEYLKNEIIKQTNNCLEQMPLIYKEPLVLFYLEEKSYEEISDILKVPIGTVATRINRAKKIMQQLCQKN